MPKLVPKSHWGNLELAPDGKSGWDSPQGLGGGSQPIGLLIISFLTQPRSPWAVAGLAGGHTAGHGNKRVKVAGQWAWVPLTPRSGTW